MDIEHVLTIILINSEIIPVTVFWLLRYHAGRLLLVSNTFTYLLTYILSINLLFQYIRVFIIFNHHCELKEITTKIKFSFWIIN